MADDQLQFTERLARCLVDRRDPDKIRHSARDLLQKRIVVLTCGYGDANDAARLADDPLTGAPLNLGAHPCPALSTRCRRGRCIGSLCRHWQFATEP